MDVSNEDGQKIVIQALLPAHHPAIKLCAPKLWVNIVKHFKIPVKNLIIQNFVYIKTNLIEEYSDSLVSKFQIYYVFKR